MNDRANKNLIFANLLLFSILAFFIAALCWAYSASLDEVVRGAGRVIPSTQIKIIQNLEGGILSEVLVKEGQEIKKNQVLMNLERTVFKAKLLEKMAEKYSLEASIARLTAEYSNKPILFDDHLVKQKPELIIQETSLLRSRKEKIKSELDIQTQTIERYLLDIKEKEIQIDHLQINLKIANKKLDILKPLVEKKSASKIELLDLEHQINQVESKIKEYKNEIPKITVGIKTAESKKINLKRKFLSAVLGELTEKESRLEALKQVLPALNDRLERTHIRSPVAGMVKRIFVYTIGAVIASGEPLVEVVPKDDELLVEAKVLPKDIAFIHPGQDVKIKLTAYDFSIYGGLTGVLDHISADAILSEEGYSYFLIRVKIDKKHIEYGNKRLPIIPGMDCQIDILSGSKTVLDYILKTHFKSQTYRLTGALTPSVAYPEEQRWG